MRADPRGLASALAFAATAAGVAYTAIATVRVAQFGRRLRAERRRTQIAGFIAAPPLGPTIAVLKPVSGLEPGLEQNLRSFCDQRYGTFHVVLGVLAPDDPALPVLRRVAAAFPGRATVVAGDGVARCANPKIATLLPMLEHARGDVLVIADSDMRVTPDYLGTVAAAFDDPRIAAATALYRGEPSGADIASVLGAMWMTEQFAPSVLVANALEPLAYCFGSTMAVRRAVLDAAGGLSALGNELADDHHLGRLVRNAGYRVALLPYVVAAAVHEPSVRALLRHELRWARTIRTLRPASYAGLLVTYPLVLALAHLALARNRRRAGYLLSGALIARLVLQAVAHSVFGSEHRGSPRLLAVREALSAAVWLLGVPGRSVRWRERDYRTTRDGRIAPGPPR